MPERISVRASESDATVDPGQTGGSTFDQSQGARGANGTYERVTLNTERQTEVDEQSGQPDTSKLIFGKYKTMEEAEKAFKLLESNVGKPKTSETPKPTETPKVEVKDFDWTDIKTEFAKDGKVSDAAYAKAAEKGITKADVDGYLSGEKAKAEKYYNDVASVVGGDENLKTLIKWANANLTPSQAKAVNAALQSGDVDQASIAIEGLNARYVAATGKDPELVNAAAVPSRSGVEPYGDVSEMIRDMSDPRYRTSPAFQKKVEARIAAGLGSGLAVRSL